MQNCLCLLAVSACLALQNGLRDIQRHNIIITRNSVAQNNITLLVSHLQS
jgi:hypothetical protein